MRSLIFRTEWDKKGLRKANIDGNEGKIKRPLKECFWFDTILKNLNDIEIQGQVHSYQMGRSWISFSMVQQLTLR